MSRLIDADWVLGHLKPYEPSDEEWGVTGGTALRLIHNAVDNAPTVDAVPVVRCWECKHHRDKNEQEQQYLVEDILICTSPDATDDCWNAVWPDHFCSYGEKEGADNG